jgi:hypothetical protein
MATHTTMMMMMIIMIIIIVIILPVGAGKSKLAMAALWALTGEGDERPVMDARVTDVVFQAAQVGWVTIIVSVVISVVIIIIISSSTSSSSSVTTSSSASLSLSSTVLRDHHPLRP